MAVAMQVSERTNGNIHENNSKTNRERWLIAVGA
jgi:hypothetical protein